MNQILNMFLSSPESLWAFHPMLVETGSESARLFADEYLVDLRKDANQVRRAVNFNYEQLMEELTPEGAGREVIGGLMRYNKTNVFVEFRGLPNRRDRTKAILLALWLYDLLMIKFKEYMDAYHNFPPLPEEDPPPAIQNGIYLCKICMTEQVSITFNPCGHVCCCENCANELSSCPICRRRIKQKIRSYF